MSQLENSIRSFVETYFQDEDAYLVDVICGINDHIQVFIDRMSKNIAIDECVKLSRFLENELETRALVGEQYNLEVSSPGMDRPFKVDKQYEKSIGRELSVKLSDGIVIEGILKSFDSDKLELEEHRDRKRQEPEIIMHAIARDEISTVKKKITFKKNKK